ncbi:COG4223 family protein [Pelagibacterium lentulum]|uniref:Membrane protein n=1 Tax=Pelagibacterium lentulum TaxID=2029865 RepID=A0A916R5T5_9HYPH|nr:hypothetical protein [Pelagibacterium lentulum]GGA36230.1 membrane protein [Pelagibacterium lentulum]
MVDKKSGPVKPPVIEGNARRTQAEGVTQEGSQDKNSDATKASVSQEPKSATGTAPAGGDKPEAAKGAGGQASARKDAKPPQSPTGPRTGQTRPSENPGNGGGLTLGIAAGLGGALAGVALAYGLAYFGYWPQPPMAAPTGQSALDARLATLENAAQAESTRIGDIAGRLDALEAAPASNDTDAGQSIAALENTLAAQAQQLSDLAGQNNDLAARIEALALGASETDMDELAQNLGAIRSRIDELSTATASFGAEIEANQSGLADVLVRLDAMETALAEQPSISELTADRDRLARLPRAIAQLERDMNAGAPFADALGEVEALLPDLDISQQIRTASLSGLMTDESLVRSYRANLPQILAARPLPEEAGIFDRLIAQTQSALALRVSGDLDGDGPDAQLARVEAALERGDLAAAHDAARTLPQPMQDAMAPVLLGLTARIDAGNLIANTQSMTVEAQAEQQGNAEADQ